MEWRTRRGIVALGALSFGLGLAPAGANAQWFGGGAPMPPSGGATAGVPTSGAGGLGVVNNPIMNPYMNPYMNPFLNPLGTQQQMTPGNAALYFFAAQQMNGGIGSGRIGGPRAAAVSGKTAAKPEPRAGGANTPGAGASRYFNRTVPASTGTASYYSRQNSHFPTYGR